MSTGEEPSDAGMDISSPRPLKKNSTIILDPERVRKLCQKQARPPLLYYVTMGGFALFLLSLNWQIFAVFFSLIFMGDLAQWTTAKLLHEPAPISALMPYRADEVLPGAAKGSWTSSIIVLTGAYASLLLVSLLIGAGFIIGIPVANIDGAGNRISPVMHGVEILGFVLPLIGFLFGGMTLFQLSGLFGGTGNVVQCQLSAAFDVNLRRWTLLVFGIPFLALTLLEKDWPFIPLGAVLIYVGLFKSHIFTTGENLLTLRQGIVIAASYFAVMLGIVGLMAVIFLYDDGVLFYDSFPQLFRPER